MKTLTPQARDEYCRSMRGPLMNKIGFVPHSPDQAEIIFDEHLYQVAICGRKFGKSFLAVPKVLPFLFLEDRNVWFVAPNYELASREFGYLCKAVRRLGLKTKKMKNDYRTGDMYIEMPNGTLIECKSEQHIMGLPGISLDYVVLCEAAKMKRSTWEKYIEPNLTDRQGRALFTSTPEGKNWLWKLWTYGQDPDEKDWKSWQKPSSCNPLNTPETLAKRKAKVTPEFYRQEYEASFEMFVGRVFKEYDPATHYIPPFVIPPEWPRYRGIDFGYTNPFVCLWAAKSPNGSFYIYREHYREKARLDWNITQVASMSETETYIRTIGCKKFWEHDKNGQVMADEFRERGILLSKPIENITLGINRIAELLGNEKSPDAEAITPTKYYIFQTCPNHHREMMDYSWPEEKGEHNAKEMPEDKNNHTIDPARYIVTGSRMEGEYKVLPAVSPDNLEKMLSGSKHISVQRLHDIMNSYKTKGSDYA